LFEFFACLLVCLQQSGKDDEQSEKNFFNRELQTQLRKRTVQFPKTSFLIKKTHFGKLKTVKEAPEAAMDGLEADYVESILKPKEKPKIDFT
jgi:hypothetical protein